MSESTRETRLLFETPDAVQRLSKSTPRQEGRAPAL